MKTIQELQGRNDIELIQYFIDKGWNRYPSWGDFLADNAYDIKTKDEAFKMLLIIENFDGGILTLYKGDKYCDDTEDWSGASPDNSDR